MDKYKKRQHQTGANPFTCFNENHTAEEITNNIAGLDTDSAGTIIDGDRQYVYNRAAQRYTPEGDGKNIKFIIPGDRSYDPFELLTIMRFNGDYRRAIKYIEFKHLNADIPYIRVGVNYFKRIKKVNRWGVECEEIKVWNKETIKDDHGPGLLKRVHQFNDFTIEPNNEKYESIIGGNWNLYEPFPHKPHNKPVSISEIPCSAEFITHIFGDQLEMGYTYFKVLYQYPKQILPVLALVSKERNTGKSSVLNWLDIIFGNNYTEIPPEDLGGSFNSHFAYRNIIGIDEAVVDRTHAIEKIKSIVTAKTILVNQKQIAQYRIPFYGKVVLTTNREDDFMRVDDEEIRFWVRKMDPIPPEKISDKFYDQLIKEVPKFLRYLADFPDIDFTRSRMVFTADEIDNNQLKAVKEQSKSTLYKDIELYVTEFFTDSDAELVEFTPKDLAETWFRNNGRVSASYIKRVLKDEFKLNPSDPKSYNPIDSLSLRPNMGDWKTGRVYTFKREWYDIAKKGTNGKSNKGIF